MDKYNGMIDMVIGWRGEDGVFVLWRSSGLAGDLC